MGDQPSEVRARRGPLAWRSALRATLGFFSTLAVRDWFAPALVALVGVLSSITIAAQVASIADVKDHERFGHAVAQTEDSIESRIDTYIAMLRAGVGMVKASGGYIDGETFRRFVQPLQLQRHYPGIQGIGYSVLLPGRTVNEAERGLRAYGAAGLHVYPASPREEYHAIVHLEPLDERNQAALGFDMFSEPVRRQAMQRARDTGAPAVSGRVELVQEIDEHKQAGFLIYLPVYSGADPPRDVAERRARLQGFVYSPFRADDLMQGILGSAPRPRLHFAIYDGEPRPENLLHVSPGARAQHPMRTTRTMDVAGRTWTVVYETRPEFSQASSRGFAPIALLAGLMATALLVFLVWRQGVARRQAERSAAQAQSSALRLEVLNASAARLASELDREALLQAITDAGRSLTGAEIGAFFYNVVNDQGESYQLFTLAGAPREAFSKLGMPRNTAIFGPTFKGEGVVRADDIKLDPRFGKNPPHHGFPSGHWPVRSYLAVPVISGRGEVLGGLFYGHSQVGMFDSASEHFLQALAAHAAIALENASLFAAAQDEIARRAAVEEQQKLLLHELNHRVKNTLATVQSIAAQTLRTSPEPDAFREAFEKRLVALSKAHNLLATSNWRGASLHDLVRRELEPHGVDDAGRISISGPVLWLPPAQALALAMVLHELATNAARHGALSRPTGRVDLSWSVAAEADGQRLRMVWRELGGPQVRPPARRGFGSRLIERGLAQELGGTARLLFEPEGLRCIIEAVLPAEAQAA